MECGYERLAELQEEILWLCEAARLPVIWAPKSSTNSPNPGNPPEPITDAAVGVRAAAVMLNKGPDILAPSPASTTS